MMIPRLPDQVALQSLLENLSAELLVLASAAIKIEDEVGAVISEGASGGERLLVPLQGLDHLAQTANELATFIDSLSRSVDPGIILSVSTHIHSIGLRSLAEALAGHSCRTGATTDGVGDVDLF